jgi:hypothetical protein
VRQILPKLRQIAFLPPHPHDRVEPPASIGVKSSVYSLLSHRLSSGHIYGFGSFFEKERNMFQLIRTNRWLAILSLALMITLATLLPVAAQGGAPCYLQGSWYPHGSIIHSGPVLQVCDDGNWRVVVFHHWDLIQRLDPKLLDKFIKEPPFPDPKPWCLSCPPELTVKLDSKTLQRVDQEMTMIVEGLKRIDQIVHDDPAFGR